MYNITFDKKKLVASACKTLHPFKTKLLMNMWLTYTCIFLFIHTDIWHVHQSLQQFDLRTLCTHLQAERLRQWPAPQGAAVLGEHDGIF